MANNKNYQAYHELTNRANEIVLGRKRNREFWTFINSSFVEEKIRLFEHDSNFSHLNDIYDEYERNFADISILEPSCITMYIYSRGIDVLHTNIKEIRENMFYNIPFIHHVFINYNLSRIEPLSFRKCDIETIEVDNLNKTFDSRNNCNCVIETKTNTLILGSFSSTIPNSVIKIGNGAFAGLASPDRIGYFRLNAVLQFKLPKSIITIDDKAFFDSNLFSITIPDSVKYIGKKAFADCLNLTNITFGKNVEKLGEQCFQSCKALRDINLSSKIREIPKYCFYKCSRLINIRFPKKLKIINEHAFDYCPPFKNIDFFNGLEEIGCNAFVYESSELFISSSIKKIDPRAFDSCRVNWFSVDPSNDVYDSRNNCGSIIETKTNTLVRAGAMANIIPNSIKSLGEYCFKENKVLENVVLNNSIESIGKNVFEGCEHLKSIIVSRSINEIPKSFCWKCSNLLEVDLPQSIETIGDYSFCLCENLRIINVPFKCHSIGNRAFGSCNNLETLFIPKSIKTIEKDAFSLCGNLKTVYFKGTPKEWNKIKNKSEEIKNCRIVYQN